MRTYIPDGYEISAWQYKELLALCRQYDELRQKLQDCYSIGSSIVTDLPRGGAKTSIVERKADDAQKYAAKIERIEQAAMKAAENSEPLYVCLLRNVTRGVTYENMDCPCGRRQFYAMRRRFFYILSKT